jgi:hypothetical protein
MEKRESKEKERNISNYPIGAKAPPMYAFVNP